MRLTEGTEGKKHKGEERSAKRDHKCLTGTTETGCSDELFGKR